VRVSWIDRMHARTIFSAPWVSARVATSARQRLPFEEFDHTEQTRGALLEGMNSRRTFSPRAQEPDPMAPLDRSRRSFLKTSLALAATTPLVTGSVWAQRGDAGKPLLAYVGTFSSPLRDVLPTQVDLPPGNGRGIHLFQVNRATGALTPAGITELGTSPSCLVVNAARTILYSANETDRIGKDREGTVSAFAIDRTDGHLTVLNTVRSGGAGPTYVSIHPSGRFVLVANYFGGSVAVLPILANGRLGEPSDVKQDAGKLGPTRATHAPPGSFAFSGHDRTHAHMIQSDPSGRFVLHVDLGLDQIFVWKFDPQKGVLTPNEPPAVSLPPGDGPRHTHFHPNGHWFYSIQEEGSTIVLFDYDAATGRLTPRQTISSLPPGFAGSNFCSEILVSADGRFVYGGNRLHDSIAIFSIGPNGELTFVADEPTRGNYPRSFNFDPSGQFLYCCNQRGDNIAVFQVDRQSGLLKFTGHYAQVGNPSIIVFLDLARVG
jgi:6-phosphogluconolactonase (cycloisomerase 2 family)